MKSNQCSIEIIYFLPNQNQSLRDCNVNKNKGIFIQLFLVVFSLLMCFKLLFKLEFGVLLLLDKNLNKLFTISD